MSGSWAATSRGSLRRSFGGSRLLRQGLEDQPRHVFHVIDCNTSALSEIGLTHLLDPRNEARSHVTLGLGAEPVEFAQAASGW